MSNGTTAPIELKARFTRGWLALNAIKANRLSADNVAGMGHVVNRRGTFDAVSASNFGSNAAVMHRVIK